jgi:hypothetical protein
VYENNSLKITYLHIKEDIVFFLLPKNKEPKDTGHLLQASKPVISNRGGIKVHASQLICSIKCPAFQIRT